MAKTVLIVDDNEFIRQVLCDLFQGQADFEVCADAENGREAIETSVADLARKLRKYIGVYAKSARPFRWTYTDPQRRIHVNEITGTAY